MMNHLGGRRDEGSATARTIFERIGTFERRPPDFDQPGCDEKPTPLLASSLDAHECISVLCKAIVRELMSPRAHNEQMLEAFAMELVREAFGCC